MIETLTIITLSVLYLVFFRPGKTPPLNNPLVIERPGQYHMTLAPQLNLAQPFIEAVAQQAVAADGAARCSATQYFEVRDKQVTAHGHDRYLLALTLRDGMLYVQAASPQPGGTDSHFRIISEFAARVLARFPVTGAHDTALDERIMAATPATAEVRKIHVKNLGG
jgi:hypothetical protein